MVSQAAGQTRFRTLKHENGIAGSAAIVIRVIACFQPLQDCQAEYFRQLLKPVIILDHRSPNMNLFGHPNSIPAYMKPYYDEVSPNGPPPSFASSGLSQVRANQADDNCFYSLPHFRQAFGPVLSSVPEEKNLPTGTSEKRFLVFDQSGDQTTLLYSSAIGGPVPPLYSWKNGPVAKGDTVSPLEPFLSDEHQNEGVESEMHEDTEELNALLYSDDDYSEETSTGHSPSTMTAQKVQSSLNVVGEEVASCGGSIMEAELVDTASSLKRVSRPISEDDAESSYSQKRSRKENIRETIRILQKVIPDGQGKDTMDIIDEAIVFLKSLKAKAKDLGLDARPLDSDQQ